MRNTTIRYAAFALAAAAGIVAIGTSWLAAVLAWTAAVLIIAPIGGRR